MIVLSCLLVSAISVTQDPIDLFIANTDPGVNNYRIPALVRSADGTLIAFAEARSENSDCAYKWTVYRTSNDNGTTWSGITNLYKPTISDETAGNPAVVYDSIRGNVVVIIAIGDSKHCNPTKWTLVFKSSNNGQTWTPPINISCLLNFIFFCGLDFLSITFFAIFLFLLIIY